jgi:hypothetical protein
MKLRISGTIIYYLRMGFEQKLGILIRKQVSHNLLENIIIEILLLILRLF